MSSSRVEFRGATTTYFVCEGRMLQGMLVDRRREEMGQGRDKQRIGNVCAPPSRAMSGWVALIWRTSAERRGFHWELLI